MRQAVLNGPELLPAAPALPAREPFPQVTAPCGHDWQSRGQGSSPLSSTLSFADRYRSFSQVRAMCVV
jgi:hypothetical protein